MISENIVLFPTMITVGKREVDEVEKESWFSAYQEMSNTDGESMDYIGYQSIHHDKRFMKVYSDIASVIRDYLKCLNITKDLNINITKSWFNIKTVTGNPIHNHAENHISFTYYPHIHEKYKDKQLVFFNEAKSLNEPYDGFFDSLVDGWNNFNCKSYSFPVAEGNIFVCPGNMNHGVGEAENQTTLESFKNKDDLINSRFCVGGDVILTRKDTKDYNGLLTPIENWRKF